MRIIGSHYEGHTVILNHLVAWSESLRITVSHTESLCIHTCHSEDYIVSGWKAHSFIVRTRRIMLASQWNIVNITNHCEGHTVIVRTHQVIVKVTLRLLNTCRVILRLHDYTNGMQSHSKGLIQSLWWDTEPMCGHTLLLWRQIHHYKCTLIFMQAQCFCEPHKILFWGSESVTVREYKVMWWLHRITVTIRQGQLKDI